MGTFREPVFLVTFFFPIILLYLYNTKEKNIIISIVAGIALGLTRSNYLKLFCIIFLAFLIIEYLLKKKLKVSFKPSDLIDTPFELEKIRSQKESKQAEDDLKRDNSLNEMLEKFDGKIKKVSKI